VYGKHNTDLILFLRPWYKLAKRIRVRYVYHWSTVIVNVLLVLAQVLRVCYKFYSWRKTLKRLAKCWLKYYVYVRYIAYQRVFLSIFVELFKLYGIVTDITGYCMSEWREFHSGLALQQNIRWQLASRSCCNRVRPWNVSEFLSFLKGVGLQNRSNADDWIKVRKRVSNTDTLPTT